ncbi:hypothetical protein N9J63_04330 [Gammaproteobacteria bacterium]|nr:hypothetical protein [Gammaproteobacteria bacterium]
MKTRKKSELFSMSFLDIMACGFGALVLILLISEFQETEIKVVINDANKLLDTNDLMETRINELSVIDDKIDTELIELSQINNNIQKLKIILKKRQLISKNLNDLASDNEYSINKKRSAKQNQPIEQNEASGIKIDSRYLVFIIDNSGSMQTSGPWSRVLQEIDSIIQTFPSLEGYLILNDAGKTIHGGSPWLKPSKSNRSTSINLLKANPNKYMSLSNPVIALKVAINRYGVNYKDVGVFVVGDDVLDNNRIENISNDILKLNSLPGGLKKVRINAIAFLTAKDEAIYEQQNMNYLILMRELTEQSGGALVVVN